MNYFPSRPIPENYNSIPNETYSFITSTLLAEHPPIGDASHKVVTTGWVHKLLLGNPNLPIVRDASIPIGTGLSIHVTSGEVDKPNGEKCFVDSTISPIAVVSSSIEFVFIRYTDCEIVVSTVVPNPEVGRIIAKVTTDEDSIVSIENYSTSSNWAKNHSPFFTGDPQVPHPPINDYDHSIASTKWVIDRINDFINDIPDIDLPKIYKVGKLRINITEGKITNPDGNEVFDIFPLTDAIAVRSEAGINGNDKEQVWLRYSDGNLIVTGYIPKDNEGFRIAEIESNEEEITNIQHLTGPLSQTLMKILEAILPQYLAEYLDQTLEQKVNETVTEIVNAKMNLLIAQYGGNITQE